MKIDQKELYKLYMRRVDFITEECDWVTSFGPEEIVGMISDILEKNPNIIQTVPHVSDDFQIGPEGAYEAIEVPCAFCDNTIDLAKEDTCSECNKSHFLEPGSWDHIYEEYKGVSDLLDFVQWLSQNYNAPTKK